jgi:hypothetical protein
MNALFHRRAPRKLRLYNEANRAAQLCRRARFAGKSATKTVRNALDDSVFDRFHAKKGSSRPVYRNSIRLSVATFIESLAFRRHRGFELMKARRKRAKAAASKGAKKTAPKKKKKAAKRKKAKK